MSGKPNLARIVGVFTGHIRPLPPEGRPTGMFKAPVIGPVQVGPEGLAGDQQADRRVHGGPEKAVHVYPMANYARLAKAWPRQAPELVPGSMGENLTVADQDQTDVCLGDIISIGSCRLQVSQPRSPCWKINHRFDEEHLAKFIYDEGLTGWYCRVLKEGSLQTGDSLNLLERNPAPVSLDRLWRLHQTQRPEVDELRAVAATPGLNPDWVKKLRDRLAWLERNP